MHGELYVCTPKEIRVRTRGMNAYVSSPLQQRMQQLQQLQQSMQQLQQSCVSSELLRAQSMLSNARNSKSIRQHTSAYVSTAYVSIRLNSIRQGGRSTFLKNIYSGCWSDRARELLEPLRCLLSQGGGGGPKEKKKDTKAHVRAGCTHLLTPLHDTERERARARAREREREKASLEP
jgi:hypothetical protein